MKLPPISIQLSKTEKFAAVSSAIMLAALTLMLSLKIRPKPKYSDFIVGNITWGAGSKFQDLIAAPAFIFALFGAFLFFTYLLKKVKTQNGNDRTQSLATQLLWWALPAIAAFFGMVLSNTLDRTIVVISAAGIGFITAAVFYNSCKGNDSDPEKISLVFLSALLIGFIPLEIAIALSKLPTGLICNSCLPKFINASYALILISIIAGALYSFNNQEKFKSLPAKMALLAQIGLPLLFLTLYPARLQTPTGGLTKYETTIWLKLLIAGLALWTLIDVVRRYKKYSREANWTKIFSPIAILGILILFKAGGTAAPSISSDDYHFGEFLLGWWSYANGTIPYVGYLPAHGLIDDNFSQFISFIIYDGTAGTMSEAGRLTFATLVFAAFLSLYRYTGSIAFAFVCIYFLGGRLGWYFLVPFICLWFSPTVRSNPSKWLGYWIATVPIVILGIPGQGLLLVAASGILAVYAAWKLFYRSEKIYWLPIAIPSIVLIVLCLLTPLGHMLFGAIRYVLENGPINQVAYGAVWEQSWNTGARSGFIFELIRMSWVLVPLACIGIIYKNKDKLISGDIAVLPNAVLPALVVLLFVLLLIPYSMGRIDQGWISRMGMVGALSWAVLLPAVGWLAVEKHNRVVLLFTAACICATLGSANISMKGISSVANQKINTAPLKDGASAGLPNIGTSYVQDDHWARLIKLNKLLNVWLKPEEPYLDLTSRNAQYFYLNRKPLIEVTAPYNMVPLAQQKRAVETLSKNLPTLALLSGENIIHDGGGLALRNPYLYRFVIDNYIPGFEDGFIVGFSKNMPNEQLPQGIKVMVKNITDESWDRGIHRSEAAVTLDDPLFTSILKAGDKVEAGDGKVRLIKRVSVKDATVWLDGPALGPSLSGYPNILNISADTQTLNQYRALLFYKAFSQPDLVKIPVAWGQSESTLKDKMTVVSKLSEIMPMVHDLSGENGSYKVLGKDPQLSYDLSSLNLSGHEAGLLRFEFKCSNKDVEPGIQVSWWGDNEQGPTEAKNVRFTAKNGTLIVPLDSSALWLTTKKVNGIRIDLAGANACSTISLKNISLQQRVF